VDPEFRRLCLNDARRAIAAVTDIPIPPGFHPRFIEKQGYNMTIVLPDPAAPEGELSEEEMEQVAAGSGGLRPQPPIVWDEASLMGRDPWYDIPDKS
jgi:hypothetical protein